MTVRDAGRDCAGERAEVIDPRQNQSLFRTPEESLRVGHPHRWHRDWLTYSHCADVAAIS